MGGFAIVAHEGVVFDADGAEAVFAVGAAVGAGGVAPLTGEVFDGCFGGGWHGYGSILLSCYFIPLLI